MKCAYLCGRTLIIWGQKRKKKLVDLDKRQYEFLKDFDKSKTSLIKTLKIGGREKDIVLGDEREREKDASS